jgi:hypothetical protein
VGENEEEKMAKLVVEKGQITKQSEWNAEALSVKFVRAALSCNGDLGRVEITGNGKLELTYAQAISLANEIMRRCQ